MSVLSEKFKAIQTKLDEERKEQLARGKKVIRECFAEFFAAHEIVTAIRWTQYTPYFNDGDTCTFRVGEVYILIEGKQSEEEDGYLSSWKIRKEFPDLSRDINEISGVLESMSDVMLGLFDDHKQVTVPRVGDAMTEEYNHD